MDIIGFKEQHRWLSNFWPAEIKVNGIVYPTVEHAYVAMKTNDVELRKEISKLSTPGKAKSFGRQLIVRDNWDEIKVEIMYELLKLKFNIPELKEKLLGTNSSIIVEENTWNDTFWGVCAGKGSNTLGLLLMRIRQEIKNR